MAEADRPKLSIGLPVYNGERYLSEAIRSILDQTFRDFELIISDNASTDQTETICRQFASQDDRIRYYRNEQNVGASRNFAFVYQLAKGEYFKWAAHDDLLAPTFFERCIEALDNDPSAVLSYSKVLKIDEDGKVTGTYDYEMNVGASTPHERFHDLIMVNHWCIAVFGIARRQALANTRLIAPYVASDRVLLAELGLLGRHIEVPEYLFSRRDHPHTSTRETKVYGRLWWFDPTKSKNLYFPYWRVGSEYLKSVRRVPLKTAEKLRCYGTVGKWFLRRRRFLVEDIKANLVKLFPGALAIKHTLKSIMLKRPKTSRS